MKQLGDIRKINGADVPAVNVVIGGSPCQDLSVAGKRTGLAGERSGLFLEQMRVIREMRAADEKRGRMGERIRPRFMVWENVPGAFSSNKGADFGAVLQECAKVVCEAPAVPVPKNGWPAAGCISGMGYGGVLWTVAWRVFDAQFWGVPQRRRRIALVADFGGCAAPEILFERESVPGNPEPGEAARKEAPADTGKCADRRDCTGDSGGKVTCYCIAGNCVDRAARQNGKGWKEDTSFTLNCNHEQPIVFDCRGNGDGKTVPTITGGHEANVGDYTAVILLPTVRRLTPLECERLQGFPDGWTDIPPTEVNGKLVKPSDSARYKALGNSIALPPWRYVLEKLTRFCGEERTMGSLFDGIGGFPLIWEALNGKGACLWASEIEKFPLAVTKRRFSEDVL